MTLVIKRIDPGNYHIYDDWTDWTDFQGVSRNLEVHAFLKSFNDKEVDTTWRFNNGRPYVSIEFLSEEAETMFVIGWGHAISEIGIY